MAKTNGGRRSCASVLARQDGWSLGLRLRPSGRRGGRSAAVARGMDLETSRQPIIAGRLVRIEGR
jgi:hypothetical protein